MKITKLEQRTLASLEKELWGLCKKITRKVYRDCFTCSQKNLQGMNCQTGHYFPKGALSAALKYDLRVLRLQCFQCNINHGGMGGVFRENMAAEIGKKAEQKLYNECISSKGKPIKARDHYIKLIADYQIIYEGLCSTSSKTENTIK